MKEEVKQTELPFETEVAHIMAQVEELNTLLCKAETKQQVSTTRQPKMQRNESVKVEVLDVLKQGHIESNQYYLPSIRLERKLYLAVNEVLERIGGKWNKKAKAHVFEDVDPAQLLDLVVTNGEMPPKNPTAFFATPQIALDAMPFHLIPANATRILEPSAGKGNIARAVRQYCQSQNVNAKIHCCEILPRFQQLLLADSFDVVCADFLDYSPTWKYDAIAMNPPFAVEGDALSYVTHIEHAWSLLADGGALIAVAPAGFVFRTDKRIVALREQVEQYGSWQDLASGSFKESGTGVSSVIITMQK